MRLRKTVAGISALFLLLPAGRAQAAESADSKIVKINVKGLACPFCAYGLEKRLKETGADKVKIYIDKGMAQISYAEKKSLDLEQVKEAVKKGGFNPGSIEMIAKGALSQKDRRWIFELANSKDLFLVKMDEVSEKMIKEVKAGTTVRILAAVETIVEQGHGEHPASLKILSYEKLK